MTAATTRKDDAPSAPTLADMINDHLAAVPASLPERGALYEACLDAYVSGTHLLVLGPPGTGKTHSVQAFAKASAQSYFYVQFHRQLPLEDLFGPIDPREFRDGKYVRNHRGTAAEARICVFDEFFKAGPTSINPLLTFMSQRQVKQGTDLIDCPMRVCVGISNEIPEADGGLDAAHDRFCQRLWIEPIRDDAAWSAMVTRALPAFDGELDPAVLESLRTTAEAMTVQPATLAAFRAIITEVRERGIVVSDRRAQAALDLLKARASRLGSPSVGVSHLAALESCLWNRREEIPTVQEVIRKHAAPWLREVQDINASIDEVQRHLADALRSKSNRDSVGDAIVRLNTRLRSIKRDDLPKLAEHGDEANEAAERLAARVRAVSLEIVAAGTKLGVLSPV